MLAYIAILWILFELNAPSWVTIMTILACGIRIGQFFFSVDK